MEKVIEFVSENSEILILLSACLLDLILFLFGVFRKKRTTPIGEIIQSIPGMISFVEKKYGSGNGVEKKNAVMVMALALYKQLTGVAITESSFIGKEISSFIEKVLKTPQKKG